MTRAKSDAPQNRNKYRNNDPPNHVHHRKLPGLLNPPSTANVQAPSQAGSISFAIEFLAVMIAAWDVEPVPGEWVQNHIAREREHSDKSVRKLNWVAIPARSRFRAAALQPLPSWAARPDIRRARGHERGAEA